MFRYGRIDSEAPAQFYSDDHEGLHSAYQNSGYHAAMFFDLNIPIKKSLLRQNLSKKGKQGPPESVVNWTTSEIAAIEARIDLLVHC
jgi:hypothetical protein